MRHISVKEARQSFRKLLDDVSSGDEVIVTRRGQEIVRMGPAHPPNVPFPSHKSFRDSIKVKGKASSKQISEMRDEDSR